MLNRIFWFTSASALVAVWILRLYLPGLDLLLNRIDFTVEFGGNKMLPIPGGYLLPALAVGILTRIFRLHARMSDWLGIRETFDIRVIIGEFADQLGIDLSAVEDDRLIKHRHTIMRKAFYPFASGPKPQIDPHLIAQALDAWSWFWIGVEATLVFVLAGLGLVAGGVYTTGLQLLGGTLVVAALALPAMREQCRRYAIAQVRAILGEPVRVEIVRKALAELTRHHVADRRAA
jgi:hypothetical protein